MHACMHISVESSIDIHFTVLHMYNKQHLFFTSRFNP